ncbi:curli-like amyloid fiber formation chaperone CsgH [Rhizobium sp. S163]|uniref:curli-like amyloid fiber formation chaperone CsgH n=1 Tax=Rhizobium sp. S163 TaxID=3055039 RepID=UPI0025A957BE|nr:curli-like amyloid fiber formation chaperone CsgH [Rhizobium sp. S163]MDM9646723.1 curli-like amyloid fiber formation chaperone CsgH [Rhizobium sp. S163]
MQNIFRLRHRLLAVLAVVLVPVGTVSAMKTASQHDGVQLCEIKATPGVSEVRLDALIHADHNLGGNYTFHVVKLGQSGSSSVNQSGDFDATAGRTTTLSSVSLDAKGGSYEATLDVVIAGKRFSCAKKVDGK